MGRSASFVKIRDFLNPDFETCGWANKVAGRQAPAVFRFSHERKGPGSRPINEYGATGNPVAPQIEPTEHEGEGMTAGCEHNATSRKSFRRHSGFCKGSEATRCHEFGGRPSDINANL
jgi:hypothetical protein